MSNSNHFVYILECSDGTYYTGYTNDITKRLKKHQSGKAAKYTRGRAPVDLVYTQSFHSKEMAMKEEYRIKQLTRNQKEQMIEKQKGSITNVATTKL